MLVSARVSIQGSEWPCGVYMNADYWWQAGFNTPYERWAFMCEFSPAKLKVKQPQMYEIVKEAMENKFPGLPEHMWTKKTPCCGSKFIPYKYGASMVVELNFGGERHAILAERLPKELDDEIKHVLCEWHKAEARVTAAEIRAAIPCVLPETNLCEDCPVPGIAKFDFNKWKREGCPTLLAAGWIAICKVIANKDKFNLSRIITLCDEMFIKEEKDPDLKLAMQMSRGFKATKPVR